MANPSDYVPEGVSEGPWRTGKGYDYGEHDGSVYDGVGEGATVAFCEHQGHEDADAAYIAHAANTLPEALALLEPFVAWWEHEDTKPPYPEGTGRDSPGGEAIWREWWDECQTLCQRASDAMPEARALILSAREFAKKGAV